MDDEAYCTPQVCNMCLGMFSDAQHGNRGLPGLDDPLRNHSQQFLPGQSRNGGYLSHTKREACSRADDVHGCWHTQPTCLGPPAAPTAIKFRKSYTGFGVNLNA